MRVQFCWWPFAFTIQCRRAKIELSRLGNVFCFIPYINYGWTDKVSQVPIGWGHLVFIIWWGQVLRDDWDKQEVT